MEIVINIDEKDYNNIEPFLNGETIKGGINLFKTLEIIKNGIPLPKGHGRLIDVDDIKVIELEDSLHIIQHCKGDDVDVYIDAPTIIEADTESEE